jgi:hypothetical protein
MKHPILILIAFSIFFCCQPSKDKPETAETTSPIEPIVQKPEQLPPLVPGISNLTDEVFGEIINLKAISHPVENIFRIREPQMIVKDSIMIIKNLNDQNMFMAYEMPGFRYIKSFGKHGKGPDEFQYPSLVKSHDAEAVCYIYEKASDKLFALNSQLEIFGPPISLPKGTSVRRLGDKQIHSFSKSEFFYVESIPRGKAFFEWQIRSDTSFLNQLKNISFSEEHKNWAAYIGNFGASARHKRLAFAYKYFKRLVFYDIENGTSKIVSFEQKETRKGDTRSMLDPSNVTHYWGMSAEPDYLYVLYPGRTPIEVTKELNETSGYIYVEQFDWNGNPIRKFKLDHWGFFYVDESHNKIYLASHTEEHPFFSFDLP